MTGAPRINPAAPFNAAAWARAARAHGCGVWLRTDKNTGAGGLYFVFGDPPAPHALWQWLRPDMAEGERREAALVEHLRHLPVHHVDAEALWSGWPHRAREQGGN